MAQTANEIVKALGGTNATARFFGVRPPSVSAWLDKGVIPDERLMPKAALIETRTHGAFSRRDQWPERAAEIWPDLAAQESAHG